MTEVIIQRRDRAAYFESYPLYINREQVGRIGFAETYKLNLEPGRYQLHCGGLFGLEDNIWLDIGEHRKALFLSAEFVKRKYRPWPKYYRVRWTETTPMQIKSDEEQAYLKNDQANALIRAFAFAALLCIAAAWLFWQSQVQSEIILQFFAGLCLGFIPWAYRGVLLSQIKKA